MCDKTETVIEDSVGQGGSSLEKARVYDRRRFAERRKMRRLDRFEKNFAQDLLDRAGTDATILDATCGNGRF